MPRTHKISLSNQRRHTLNGNKMQTRTILNMQIQQLPHLKYDKVSATRYSVNVCPGTPRFKRKKDTHIPLSLYEYIPPLITTFGTQ